MAIKCVKKGEIKERKYGIDVVVLYYIDGKQIAMCYERTYFFNDYESKESIRNQALRWARLCEGECEIGADINQLDSICDLRSCCPVEGGVEINCSRICLKANCGAIEVLCPKCKVRYFETSGCWQYGHDEPTNCKCNCPECSSS